MRRGRHPGEFPDAAAQAAQRDNGSSARMALL